MNQNELQAELRQARKALHLTRIQLARYGMNAPVHLIMEADDLEGKVSQLERALGQNVSEPRQLPPAPPRRVVDPPPAPHFEERLRARQVGERQRDIEHQLNLLSIHRRNLATLRAQARAYGGWQYAPFHVQNQISGERDAIAQIKDALRSFYQIVVDDLPGDE